VLEGRSCDSVIEKSKTRTLAVCCFESLEQINQEVWAIKTAKVSE
jgi:hypothetical protein